MKEKAIKDRFVELRAQGHSYLTISKQLNVAKSTLIGWSKALSQEICNLRVIEDEALLESYRIGKQHRLSLLGGLFEKMQGQLDQIDLSQVPADKLIDLTIKLASALEKEEKEVTFSEVRMISTMDLMSESLFTERKENWTA